MVSIATPSVRDMNEEEAEGIKELSQVLPARRPVRVMN
jgi:hypothetical protein